LAGNPEVVKLLLRPGKDSRLVSRSFLKKQGRRDVGWLHLYGPVDTIMNLRFRKMLKISGVAVSLIACQERLSSMELVSSYPVSYVGSSVKSIQTLFNKLW
jgi:hypothetical protein